MNECEQVIVLDVCCTIKRPTTMCLAKKKKKKKKREREKKGYTTDGTDTLPPHESPHSCPPPDHGGPELLIHHSVQA